MNKPFFRFSVGGMRDEAEIKGHRRTYVGAMPGKIIQGLKIVKTMAPVFMIDEVDKMGISYQGDPSSALLEVLDPEQNISFRDHYLDLPYDLSNILFILTANTLDSIPGPLMDRAEVIQLSGYIDTEKMEIAKKYLVPRSLEKNGLGKGQVRYDKKTLLHIANAYAREAGVRNFEKNLDKIHRKIATEIVLGERDKKERISPDLTLVEKMLGKPIFREDSGKKADQPGTAVGLAWTSMGGDTLIIEAITNPGKEGFNLTGQMGDVMKESASIAWSWVKHHIAEDDATATDWYEKKQVHLHIPEGATPKDGPSAGITMATALLSLIRQQVIRKNLAMTGELSLTGQVLPIGGLKEKTIAARRNGVREIIIPEANVRDLTRSRIMCGTVLSFIRSADGRSGRAGIPGAAENREKLTKLSGTKCRTAFFRQAIYCTVKTVERRLSGGSRADLDAECSGSTTLFHRGYDGKRLDRGRSYGFVSPVPDALS